MLLWLVGWAQAQDPEPVRAPTEVCVAAEVVRLRAAPSVDAEVQARLLRGDRVRVMAEGPEATVDGRSGRWLQVDNKRDRVWLFGAAATSACLDADLDGDGRPERVLAWLDGGGEAQVAVRAEPGRPAVALALDGLGDAARAAREVRVDVLPAMLAGQPLLRVVVEETWDAGGLTAVALVSRGAAPGTPLRRALDYAHWGDDGGWVDATLAFTEDAAFATLWTTEGTYVDDAPPRILARQTRYRLVDGVFEPFGVDAVGELAEDGPEASGAR